MPQDKTFIETARRIIKEHPEYFEALLDFEKTGKLPKFIYKKRVNFTIDESLVIKFREYCRKKGTKMSTELENCILTKIKNN